MAEDQVKVVLNIKQETFDAYVKENIDDLGMDAEEAVQDAIGTKNYYSDKNDLF